MDYNAILEQALESVLSKRGNAPFIITVAGGSCTGKSSIVVEFFKKKLGQNICVINQDDFQLGEDFKQKDTSKWKWDDPEQFAPTECLNALRNMKQGKEIQIPKFSLFENRRVSSLFLKPKKYILLDGIYSLRDGLEDLADYSIYVESPFYARFLRRVFRYSYETGVGSADIPVNLMLGSVYEAHNKFVTKQKNKANLIISSPYSIEESIFKLNLINNYLVTPEGSEVFKLKVPKEGDIKIFNTQNKNYLYVYYKGKPIVRSLLENGIFENILKINFQSF